MQGSNYDVVIVGCGTAGIAAARKFFEKGIKCLILEGRDRYGGRVCPQTLKSTGSSSSPAKGADTVEVHSEMEIEIQMGANWIHGLNSDHNPMKALADKLSLKLHQTSSDDEPGDDVLLFDSFLTATVHNDGETNVEVDDRKNDKEISLNNGFPMISKTDYNEALTRYYWIREHLDDCLIPSSATSSSSTTTATSSSPPCTTTSSSSTTTATKTSSSSSSPSSAVTLSLQTAFDLTLLQSEVIFGPCSQLHHRIITWILDRISIDLAVSLTQVSVAEYTGTESDGAEGEAVVIGGYFQIIQHLFEEYPLNVQFNHSVHSITRVIYSRNSTDHKDYSNNHNHDYNNSRNNNNNRDNNNNNNNNNDNNNERIYHNDQNNINNNSINNNNSNSNKNNNNNNSNNNEDEDCVGSFLDSAALPKFNYLTNHNKNYSSESNSNNNEDEDEKNGDQKDEDEKCVLIECSNGYKVYAKHCLLTVPVGVLLHECEKGEGIGTIHFQTSHVTTAASRHVTPTDLNDSDNNIKYSSSSSSGSSTSNDDTLPTIFNNYSPTQPNGPTTTITTTAAPSVTTTTTCANTFPSNIATTVTTITELPPVVQTVCGRYKMGLMNLVWLWFPYKFWTLPRHREENHDDDDDDDDIHDTRGFSRPPTTPTGHDYNFFGVARGCGSSRVGFSTFLAPPVYDKRTGQTQYVLMCQVVGELAREIETLSNEEVSAMCMQTLQSMFSSHTNNASHHSLCGDDDDDDDGGGAINNDNKDIDNNNNNNDYQIKNNNSNRNSSSNNTIKKSSSFIVPAPLRCSVSRWSSDPFARGSWSYVPICHSSSSDDTNQDDDSNNSDDINSNNINVNVDDNNNNNNSNNNDDSDNNSNNYNSGSGSNNSSRNSNGNRNRNTKVNDDSNGHNAFVHSKHTVVDKNTRGTETRQKGQKSQRSNRASSNSSNNNSNNSNNNIKINSKSSISITTTTTTNNNNNAYTTTGTTATTTTNNNNNNNNAYTTTGTATTITTTTTTATGTPLSSKDETDCVHYAGEAMSVKYRGTVHGAYMSGQSVADDIILCIIDKKNR